MKQDRSPEQEHERLLMQYQGVFKRHIIEYAEKVIRPIAKKRNYSR